MIRRWQKALPNRRYDTPCDLAVRGVHFPRMGRTQGEVRQGMEVRSIAETFRDDWARGVDGVVGVSSAEPSKPARLSAGTVRSLKAHADADVAEIVETIREHAGQSSPKDAAAFLDAWRGWHQEYVRAEIARLLPGLRERWPTKEERRTEKSRQQYRDRWARDGAAVVGQLAQYQAWVTHDQALANSGLRPGRFTRLSVALVKIGAVRVRSGHLLAVVSPEWAREKLRTLSP